MSEVKEKIGMVADAIAGLKYSEWCKVKMAVDCMFLNEQNKLTLDDASKIKKSILNEMLIS